MNAGIHSLPSVDYHADPCETPSLSASLAKILVTQSPAHARANHPRLNPLYQRTDEQKYDLGTAAHAWVLEGDDAVEIIHAPDWRTNAAKEARDLARAHGRVPLLTAQELDLRAMVAATRSQLDVIDARPGLFVDGAPEQTLVWEDGGVQCRARLDWLHDDHTAIDDYKTTSRSANPEQFSRNLFGMGYDIQVAFYLRGVRALTGKTPVFRFVVQETFAPYALAVVGLAPDALALADEKVEYALTTWRECLASGVWPAYPLRVCWATLPAWEEARWLEREAREEAAGVAA